MPLISDISIEATKFHPGAISEETAKLIEHLVYVGNEEPKWWEVGPANYRQMRSEGRTTLPKPTVLPQGINISIPSRMAGRSIPCRLFYPSNNQDSSTKSKGIVMHIHGGGWTLGSEQTTDPLLQFYADTTNCVAISVGYRLAPENPFPAAPQDCFDAAEWLVKNGEKEYDGPLRFIGGESAGSHLAVLTTFHLLKTFTNFSLIGLLLHFGIYDLSMLPQSYTLKNPAVLVEHSMEHFSQALLPNLSLNERKNPDVSPFYEDLEQFRVDGLDESRLPSALFTCGTADPLLDDTVMMGTKWLMGGGKAIVKIYPGSPHGFIAFKGSQAATMAFKDTREYILDRIGTI